MEELRNTKFIDFFINKEREFLIELNADAFNNKDFKFYIAWFIYAIYEHKQKEDDIEKEFIYFFTSNLDLNIIFLIYIMNKDFRQRVKNAIKEYKSKYKKEYIYD